MKRVLFINSHYFPGWRSGGPQQTIMNVVDVFGEKANLYVLTHNFDMGEQEPYPDVCYDSWTKVGNAKVYYSSKKSFSFSFLRKIVKQFDLVYLCGPYCDYTYKILLLNRIKWIKPKVILAPMGSFTKGALSNKQVKKRVFWTMFKLLGLYNGIKWSFTSEIEKKDAVNCLSEGSTQDYCIAEDLPRRYINMRGCNNLKKETGHLRIIFLSRICHQKNLSLAIYLVSKLNGKVKFDIYGAKEDLDYWQQCEKALSKVSSSVVWTYCGDVKPENVVDIFSGYDVFLFPTLGENYGHVIYEALMAGCIPLISDRTIWRNLENERCGYSTPLENIDLYIERIQQYVDMDGTQLSMQRENAMRYAEKKYQESIQSSGYKEILC